MQSKAINTLMMVSEEFFFPKNWQSEAKTPKQMQELKPKQNNICSNYHNSKDYYSGKESSDKKTKTKSLKEFKNNPNYTKSHIFNNNHNFPTLRKKMQEKQQFTQILKKKYILQNFKSLGKSKGFIYDPLQGAQRMKRVNTEVPHQINFPLCSQTSQTQHCFRNQMIKELLEQKSTYLTQLKSKINPSFNKSTIVIYSRKKTQSTFQSHNIRRKKINTTVIPQPFVSKPEKSSKQLRSKSFFIKKPETNHPKKLFKVYSLSVI